MKNKKLIITLIAVLSFISVVLVGFMIFAICTNYVGLSVSNTLVVNKSFENTFSELDISSQAGDVYIYSTSDDTVKVKVYSAENKTNLEQNGDTLTLNVKSNNNFIFFRQNISRVEVYVPQSYNGNLKIQENYGDIKVENFPSASVEIEQKCGDVKVAGCNSATVNNKYGDIKIEKINSYMNLNNNCGDIEVDEINLTKNSKITDSLGDISIGFTNEIFINAKTDLGDVKVNNNYHKSDIELTVSNNCGDIKVNN
ncbi:MAG: DUF4097 family beta strand repeat protein [Ruminococcus sp.]|nr:DUF4097 family beta strand repeat protein [Ruminococcus sp.]